MSFKLGWGVLNLNYPGKPIFFHGANLSFNQSLFLRHGKSHFMSSRHIAGLEKNILFGGVVSFLFFIADFVHFKF